MGKPTQQTRKPSGNQYPPPSTSLRGMERAVPPFPEFMRRTPPYTSTTKPLPPLPQPTSSSRAGPSLARRSSSVYSRTPSQWGATPGTMEYDHFPDHLRIPQATFQNLTAPELHDTLPTPALLEPRTYSPLIDSPISSPSPTGSAHATEISHYFTPKPRATTKEVPQYFTPKPVVPPVRAPPVSLAAYNGRKPRTMSLSEAQAATRNPGYTPLLPEEMRAEIAAGRRPSLTAEPKDLLFNGSSAAGKPGPPPQLPRFVGDIIAASGEISFRRDTSVAHAPTSKLIHPDVERGRTTHRRSSTPHQLQTFGPPRELSHGLSRSRHDSPQAQQSNHSIGVRDYASSNHRGQTPDSIDSIRETMKLVPQPLFFNPRQVSEQRLREYKQQKISDVHQPPSLRRGPSAASTAHSAAREDRRLPSNPVRVDVDSPLGPVSRRSSSGLIPISPPFDESDNSPTPLLGVFASPPSRARQESPHLHSLHTFPYAPNQDTRGTNTSHAYPPAVPKYRRPTNASATSADKPKGRDSLPSAVSRGIVAGKKAFVQSAQWSKDVLIGPPPGASVSGRTAERPLRRVDQNFHYARGNSINQSSRQEPKKDWTQMESLKEPMMEGLRKGSLRISEAIDNRRASKANKRREELKKIIKVVPLESQTDLSLEQARQEDRRPSEAVKHGDDWL